MNLPFCKSIARDHESPTSFTNSFQAQLVAKPRQQIPKSIKLPTSIMHLTPTVKALLPSLLSSRGSPMIFAMSFGLLHFLGPPSFELLWPPYRTGRRTKFPVERLRRPWHFLRQKEGRLICQWIYSARCHEHFGGFVDLELACQGLGKRDQRAFWKIYE
jgi:hypothetical protein